MKRFGVCAALIASWVLCAFAQKAAVDIRDEEVKTVLRHAPANGASDQQLVVVDLGTLNLGVGILHRGALKDTGKPVAGLAHTKVTETYVIVSGEGTLVTGGTIVNGRPFPPEHEIPRILAGPTVSGPIQDGSRRRVVPRDVIVIPAGMPHGFSEIPDHIDYLSVRPDPEKVLPAGYVNPLIKK